VKTGEATAPKGPARSGRPDDKLRAVVGRLNRRFVAVAEQDRNYFGNFGARLLTIRVYGTPQP
jgi:hypothetical protein